MVDSSVAPYLDYMRAELIKLRAEYVFSAALANSIYEYLTDLRTAHEGSKTILEKLVRFRHTTGLGRKLEARGRDRSRRRQAPQDHSGDQEKVSA